MTMLRAVKVWDISIRLFHWSLVLLLPLLWLLAEQDEALSDWAGAHNLAIEPMLWHARLGYIVLGLLVFRLLWGVVGSDTARFSRFVTPPKMAFAYLKSLLGFAPSDQQATPIIGHNPAGGWMVLLMLLLLILQTVSGLFNVDDVDFEAPLYALVGEAVSDFMHEWHEINFNLLLAAVVVHLNAIAFYTWIKRERLVPAMINGNRQLAVDVDPRIISGWRLLACLLTGAVCTWLFWTW